MGVHKKLNVGIVGGGINGLACAWHLSKQKYQVDLFEKSDLMSGTSSASTKLLHGGLRYLKFGKVGLVREALRERERWVQLNDRLVQRIKIIIPTYKYSKHPRWAVSSGLFLYQKLAGSINAQKSRYLSKKEITSIDDGLTTSDLICGHEFYDAQMDDYALGRWVADQASIHGTNFHENCAVEKIESKGFVHLSDGVTRQYDRIINATGPWAKQLLNKSNIVSPNSLTLVRGSHLLLDTTITQGYLLESPKDQRLFFVLPYKNKVLVGTTEVQHDTAYEIKCSPSEKDYLFESFRFYFPKLHVSKITTFSGVRPLIKTNARLSAATREYRLEKIDNLITIWGGKWTTSYSLARKVETLI